MSFFQSLFRRRERAPAEPEPGSLVDHAKREINEQAGRAYNWINTQSPWAAARIDDCVNTVTEMESRGYNRHFNEFNESLLRPLTQGLPDVVRGVRATATCAPNQDPKAAFELWNVLCFWLTVVIMLCDLLLPFGSAFAELVGVGFRYLAAYTLHFACVRVPNRRWMLVALIVLGLYVTSCIFAGVGGIVLLLPAVFSFATAACNAVLFFYLFQLYSMLEASSGAAAMDML